MKNYYVERRNLHLLHYILLNKEIFPTFASLKEDKLPDETSNGRDISPLKVSTKHHNLKTCHLIIVSLQRKKITDRKGFSYDNVQIIGKKLDFKFFSFIDQ